MRAPRAGKQPAPATEGWLSEDLRPLDWNGPRRRPFVPFEPADLDQPVVAHVERVARRNPDRLAVTDGMTALTYGGLWTGACALAEAIAARTQPGEAVAILLPAAPAFPLAMLACLAAGRPFVALDPHHPADWLGQVLADARPVLILSEAELCAEVAPETPRLSPDAVPQAAQPLWRPVRLHADAPACVLFTSGSTGRPKGIVNSQRNLLQRVGQSVNAAHINAEDRLLTLASPSTIVGVRDILTGLFAGASLRLLDPNRAGARHILQIVRDEPVTILFAFPALLRSVVAAGPEGAGGCLRLVRIGGDTTLWSDIDRLRMWLGSETAIQLIYAATEAPMMQWFVDDACRGADPRIPIGYPLPGNRLAIVDEAGLATPPGEIGELVVASPYVALGTWTDGRCAAAPRDAMAAAASRTFRTGDLVRQRADGLLERIGRGDRQVKIRGARVDLEGVEAAIRQHPGVRDVACHARSRSTDGAVTLVAYVSGFDDAAPELLEDLRTLMAAAPPAMRPGRYYAIPRIPRLPSSKLDIRGLAVLDDAHRQSERAEADRARPPATPLERTVARLWGELLQTPVRGSDDDFFDSGGDSLKALAFVSELERALGLELPLTLLNETPRFGPLCAALRCATPRAYDPLVTLRPATGDAPPVFIVHGLGGNVLPLFPLAREMAWPGAVIGLQAPGLTRHDSPLSSVDEMADRYLAAVKARQPTGPYHLCGYSFGGLVAFEMARRLAGAGAAVGLLGLLDTLTSPVRWPAAVWPGLLLRGLRSRGRPRGRSASLGGSPDILRVSTAALLASARHTPGFYPGEVTLIVPAVRDPGRPLPQSIWSRYAGAVRVIPTSGDHFTMLAPPNAATTAAALERALPTDG